MDKFKQVSEAQFWRVIRPLDVTPYPVGPWPYTSSWKLRDGRLIGTSREGVYQLAPQYAPAAVAP